MKKTQKIIYAVLVLIILALIVTKFRKSGYALAPRDLTVKSNGVGGSIFDLKYDAACVPGPQETASTYTKSLTPGGICGDQQWVKDNSTYTILDGIGGSLLS